MTTPTLAISDLLDYADRELNLDDQEAQEIYTALQRLQAIDAVKVPEPVELIRCGSCGLPDMVFLKDYNTLLDLLRRETVRRRELDDESFEFAEKLQKAEAERDALQDRLNSMESLYVATIKPGDWIEP